MDGAVFSCSEVVHTVLILREINTQTSSVYESHASLFVTLNSAEDIFLIWVGLSLELHELSELESLLH